MFWLKMEIWIKNIKYSMKKMKSQTEKQKHIEKRSKGNDADASRQIIKIWII